VFKAGFQSARDPKFTVAAQRKRTEAARLRRAGTAGAADAR